MKKTIIIFLMVLVLLFTSTFPTLALGNDFTFSPLWYQSVIDSTLLEYQNLDGKYGYYYVKDEPFIISNRMCSFNSVGGLIGGYDNPSPYLYYVHSSSSSNSGAYFNDVLNFSSPLGVTVRRGQTIDLQSMMFFQGTSSQYGNLNLSNVSVRFKFSDGSYVVNVPVKTIYDQCSLGTVSVNANGVVTGFTEEVSGYGKLFNISWTNNTEEDVFISSVRIHCETNKQIGKFYYGFFAEGSLDSIVLPSYVEDNLSMISSELMTVNDNLEDALNELEAIKSELSSISEKLNESGSTTNNYYQTITQATEEQIVKQEQLDELVATARSELEEMKEVIGSVTVPTASDVSSATTSQATQMTIDDSLSNATINNVLGKLFENTTLVTMMLSCISIATVGYILYGKRT